MKYFLTVVLLAISCSVLSQEVIVVKSSDLRPDKDCQHVGSFGRTDGPATVTLEKQRVIDLDDVDTSIDAIDIDQ